MSKKSIMIPSNTLPPSRVLTVATDAMAAQQQVVAPEVKENQLPDAVLQPEQDEGIEASRDPTEDQKRGQSAEEVDEDGDEEIEAASAARLSPAEQAARERAKLRFEDALGGSLAPQPGDRAAIATRAAAAMALQANAVNAYTGDASPSELDSEV